MMTIQVSDTFFHDLEKEKKEIYNQALEDFVENISLPMTEEQIGEIVERLKR